ncbi:MULTISPECIES: tetratricopeptide repeat protein [Moraxella]|uniref:Sel1 repeat n=1 Tax=Moraxella lacunata TaxID=477 RepID=A0A1B8Q3V8_MORLA|nr:MULTISPECIES: tetratricopeptide repeat protein [Moraxella]MBE9579031.1 sel1 repeat family protein [Moraxella sp. K1664]MBE9588376.1 sel1 repeat family protein [Moraxella sp. K1630]MBE9596433.1 sel1 repeat family protein [Moraxella sp. K2450]MDH9218919.1 tetratricopeptide repeat protein [Moraxella lacunata]MDI4482987.1 sel1 repeat family protein [Moraxella lacunata]
MSVTPFVWFEFDKEVHELWQGMSVTGKRFAYHQRLSALIAQQTAFKADLESLKLLDVFLSAVKSDLAGKNVSEARVLAHDDFARLIIILAYHVVQVMEQELAQSVAKPTVSIYTAQGFSRVYARLFSQMGADPQSQMTAEQLQGFYYGMGVLCQGVGQAGQAVADRFFILPVIGARLFGTIDRTFVAGLDDDGQGVGVAEDSLYWAVHDFISRFKQLQHSLTADDRAKQLFSERSLFLKPVDKSVQAVDEQDQDGQNEQAILQNGLQDGLQNDLQHDGQDSGQNNLNNDLQNHSINPLTNDGQNNLTSLQNQTVVDEQPTSHSPAPVVQETQALQSAQSASQAHVVSPNTPHQAKSPHQSTNTTNLPPSAYKQRARASHTPKLFDEAYQDLLNINTPSDAVSEYQKATAVLTKFDAFIDGKIAEGKQMDEIVFNDKQVQARKQALALLVGLVKQGNPSAMLRLALYYFGGRGVGVDINKAVMLTKRSAEMGDIRAQKLLSRLYYQGFAPNDGGMAMDVSMGEHWLRKSADGGHPEAKKVCAYMNQVELLKSDYRTEMVSDKRYGMLFIAVGVGAVLLFILLSMMS